MMGYCAMQHLQLPLQPVVLHGDCSRQGADIEYVRTPAPYASRMSIVVRTGWYGCATGCPASESGLW